MNKVSEHLSIADYLNLYYLYNIFLINYNIKIKYYLFDTIEI